MLRFFAWCIRCIVFVIVVLFAIKNTETVRIVFFVDSMSYQISLVLLMLVCFAVGSLFAFAISAGRWFAVKQEKKRLKKQITMLEQQLKIKVPPTESELVIPVHPL